MDQWSCYVLAGFPIGQQLLPISKWLTSVKEQKQRFGIRALRNAASCLDFCRSVAKLSKFVEIP